jgi:NADPH:quinone reductase-like Zn-dependent oxidoreductase
MKAVVQREYGSPSRLELVAVDKPTVGDDEVLVRVHAASVHPDVWHVVRGESYVLRLMGAGVRRPKNPIPGTDMAGRAEAVGEAVTRFTSGDDVFGETTSSSQWVNGGAYAEYVAVPADALARKPERLTFEAAAAVPSSGLIALQGVRRDGRVESGDEVLVNGAGGGVGLFAVQIANACGATVTGVDSADKLDVVRSAGADRVLDYTREDFTRSAERYDLVVDIPGNHSFSACRRVLASDGTYVLIGHDHYGATGRRAFGSLPRFVKLMILSRFVDQLPPIDFSTPPRRESMAALVEVLESGALTPVVDRTYSLEEVPEAIRYLESGQTCGKVVISIADEAASTAV